LDVAPDGRFVVAGGRKGEVLLLHVDERRLGPLWPGLSETERPFPPASGTAAVQFAEGGSFVRAFFTDGRLVTWRIADRKIVSHLLLGFEASSARFSPQGDRLLVTDLRGDFTVLDAASGVVLARISPDRPAVGAAVAFSPDGRKFAAAKVSRGLVVYDVDTLEARRFPDAAGERAVEFSRDGSQIVCLGQAMSLVDLTTSRVSVLEPLNYLRALAAVEQGAFWGLSSKDSYTEEIDPSIVELSIDPYKTVRTLELARLGGATAVSPDGRIVVSLSDAVEVRDTATGALLHGYRNQAALEAHSPLAVSADGSMFFEGLQILRARRSSDGLPVWTLGQGPWRNLVTSPDGESLFAQCDSGWRRLDPATGATLVSYPGVLDIVPVGSMPFIVTRTQSSVELRLLNGVIVRNILRDEQGGPLSVTHDGKTLIVGSSGFVQAYRIVDGALVASVAVPGAEGIQDVAVLQDGDRVAVVPWHPERLMDHVVVSLSEGRVVAQYEAPKSWGRNRVWATTTGYLFWNGLDWVSARTPR
jgi:WD40 repeat protein